MEVLRLFAMLCSLTTGSEQPRTIDHHAKVQAACQKYYADCIALKKEKAGRPEDLVLECIRERK